MSVLVTWFILKTILFSNIQKTSAELPQVDVQFPEQPNYANMGADTGNLVFVDCTSGNDATATGFKSAPFLTINAAHPTAQSSYTVSTIMITNGPCNEPTITPLFEYNYFGYGTIPPIITHGFTVTSTAYTSPSIYWEYLHLKYLNFNVAASADIEQVRMFNVIVDTGSIIVTDDEFIPSVFVNGCNFTLVNLQGNMQFTKSALKVSTLAANSLISFDGGKWFGSTSMGAGSRIVTYRADMGSLTLSSSSTGTATPHILAGLSMLSIPTIGANVNLERIGDLNQQLVKLGSATVTSGNALTVYFTQPLLNNDYFVTLTPTNVDCTEVILVGNALYLSSQTNTGFSVSVSNGCTFNWKVEIL